jgi:hypothetical protein
VSLQQGQTPSVTYSSFTSTASPIDCFDSGETGTFSFSSGSEFYFVVECLSTSADDCDVGVGVSWTSSGGGATCIPPDYIDPGSGSRGSVTVRSGGLWSAPAIKMCGASGSCTSVTYSITTYGVGVFDFYALDETNFDKFQRGQSFTPLSASGWTSRSSSICAYASGMSTPASAGQKVFLAAECKSAVDCKLEFLVTFTPNPSGGAPTQDDTGEVGDDDPNAFSQCTTDLANSGMVLTSRSISQGGLILSTVDQCGDTGCSNIVLGAKSSDSASKFSVYSMRLNKLLGWLNADGINPDFSEPPTRCMYRTGLASPGNGGSKYFVVTTCDFGKGTNAACPVQVGSQRSPGSGTNDDDSGGSACYDPTTHFTSTVTRTLGLGKYETIHLTDCGSTLGSCTNVRWAVKSDSEVAVWGLGTDAWSRFSNREWELVLPDLEVQQTVCHGDISGSWSTPPQDADYHFVIFCLNNDGGDCNVEYGLTYSPYNAASPSPANDDGIITNDDGGYTDCTPPQDVPDTTVFRGSLAQGAWDINLMVIDNCPPAGCAGLNYSIKTTDQSTLSVVGLTYTEAVKVAEGAQPINLPHSFAARDKACVSDVSGTQMTPPNEPKFVIALTCFRDSGSGLCAFEYAFRANIPSMTPSPPASVAPSASHTPTPSASTTHSATPSTTPSTLPTPSVTPTQTPTHTPSPSHSSTSTPTNTPTATRTASPTLSATSTPTSSTTSTATVSPTRTPSASNTPSVTATRTMTPTPSRSPGASFSNTPSPSVTPTSSVTPTAAVTPSGTPSSAGTPTSTRTPSPSSTSTGTPTSSNTPTGTPTGTALPTPTPTPIACMSFQELFPNTSPQRTLVTHMTFKAMVFPAGVSCTGASQCTGVRFLVRSKVAGNGKAPNLSVYGLASSDLAKVQAGTPISSVNTYPAFQTLSAPCAWKDVSLVTPKLPSNQATDSFVMAVLCESSTVSKLACDVDYVLVATAVTPPGGSSSPSPSPAKSGIICPVHPNDVVAAGNSQTTTSSEERTIAVPPAISLPAGGYTVVDLIGCEVGNSGCRDIQLAILMTNALNDGSGTPTGDKFTVAGMTTTEMANLIAGGWTPAASIPPSVNFWHFDTLPKCFPPPQSSSRTLIDLLFDWATPATEQRLRVSAGRSLSTMPTQLASTPANSAFRVLIACVAGTGSTGTCSLQYALAYTRSKQPLLPSGIEEAPANDDMVLEAPTPAPTQGAEALQPGQPCSVDGQCSSFACRGGFCCAPGDNLQGCAACTSPNGICSLRAGDALQGCPTSCSDESIRLACGARSDGSFFCNELYDSMGNAMGVSGQCICAGNIVTWNSVNPYRGGSSTTQSCITSGYVVCPDVVQIAEQRTSQAQVAAVTPSPSPAARQPLGGDVGGIAGGIIGALIVVAGVVYIRRSRPGWAVAVGLASNSRDASQRAKRVRAMSVNPAASPAPAAPDARRASNTHLTKRTSNTRWEVHEVGEEEEEAPEPVQQDRDVPRAVANPLLKLNRE